MAIKIFMLGATGFIGGDLLASLQEQYPEYEITCLVRTQDKADIIRAVYPDVKVVLGDNESAEIVERESMNADIVFHSATSADDVPGTTSICKAAAKEKGSGRPTYYIHVSGTGLLTYQAEKGQPRHGKIYNDWEGLPDLVDFPAEAPHRNVDQIVLEAAKANPITVRTAIVCPPVIYGPGRGPINKRAMITPLTVASMIKRGKGYLPTGDAAWHHVHVHDLSDLFIRLIRAAAERGGKATWNQEGYYLAESERMGWGDYCKAALARVAEAGYISPNDEEVPVWNMQEAADQVGGLAGIYYSTALGESNRARKLLGWEPKGKSVVHDMVDVIALEAKALGK